MVDYRTFRNFDPPGLVALWHDAGLGRGAAAGFTPDAFDALLFSQPYFDPAGLIVAVEERRIVGFAHAGFGVNDAGDGLCREKGVICAVVVHPELRRRGIGRELVERAERYLTEGGATSIAAGPSPGLDPFYVGLYGGSQPAGFLTSDSDAEPFFRALGYEPTQRIAVLHRGLTAARDPISVRLVNIRRKTELSATDRPDDADWWWLTRFGRMDSVRFQLHAKTGGPSLAGATVIGLDLYLPKWGQRAVGLQEVDVPGDLRRKGYGQAVILDVCKRLAQETITLVESHVPRDDPISCALLDTSGFQPVDEGVVYRKK